MNIMKTLLALINEPLNSEPFIEYTARMADDLGYNLHLTHILNPAAYPLNPGTTGHVIPKAGIQISDSREAAEKNLKEKVEKICNQVSGAWQKRFFPLWWKLPP